MKRFFLCLFLIPQLSLAAELYQLANPEKALHKDEISALKTHNASWFSRGVSPAETDELIEQIHLFPGILRVSLYTDENSQLRLDIQRQHSIGEIKFEGNSVYSDSELRDRLTLKEGDYIDDIKPEVAAQTIVQAYRNLGYLGTQVEFAIKNDPDEDKKSVLVIKINESLATKIRNVKIESNNLNLAGRLQLLFSLKMNVPLTDVSISEIEKDIKDYLVQNRYYRAEVVGPKVQINDKTKEATLVYRLERPDELIISFRGNDKDSSRNLLKALDLENFYSSNPNIIPELTQRLKTHYLKKGFARVEINGEELLTEDPYRYRVVFNIKEGAKIKINSFVLQGSFGRSQDKYIDFIQSHGSATLKKGYYIKEDLDNGLTNLITQLQNEGYLTAKVISTRVQYNSEKSAVDIMINLEEGPATNLNQIDFIGNTSFSKNELLEVAALPNSKTLHLDQLEAAIVNVKNFYHEAGFIEMKILNEGSDMIQYFDENRQANVIVKINEGPKVFVKTISLEGNSFTRDSVILNELELAPGEVITQTKLEESRLRLERTGYFSTIEVRTLEEQSNESQRTLLIKVTERDPGTFSMGFGVTNERDLTYRGYLGVVYRNLYGTGRSVSTRLDGNYNEAHIRYLENKLTLGYLEPYLLDTKNRMRINISRSKSVVDYELQKVSEVNQGTLSLERAITSHVTFIFDLWGLASVRDFLLENGRERNLTAIYFGTIGPTLDLDYRDNPFNPSAGHVSRFNIEYSSPNLGSSELIEYVKTNASLTYYWTIPQSRIVWANQYRFGLLRNLSSRVGGGVPYDKKGFILGGRSTIRGFEAGTSEVFPSRSDLKTDDTFTLTGTAYMNLIKSEFRIPVWGNFALALFYDGGNVAVENVHFDDWYRDSVGVGFHYVTPLGPLNIEYGYKLDRKDGEDTGKLHLSVGSF